MVLMSIKHIALRGRKILPSLFGREIDTNTYLIMNYAF